MNRKKARGLIYIYELSVVKLLIRLVFKSKSVESIPFKYIKKYKSTGKRESTMHIIRRMNQHKVYLILFILISTFPRKR